LGSQVKIVLALAVPTGLIIFGLFLALALAGDPVSRSDEVEPVSDLMVAAIFAAGIALIQIAGLALLRLLPWPGPRLEIETEERDDLRHVFD
jgi:hypothetical protein